MRSLYLRYDPKSFWKDYWKDAKVDPPQFIDLDIYPIYPTIKHLKPHYQILECGFGGGRVVRHLVNNGYKHVFGVEYDWGATQRLKAAQDCNVQVGDIRSLAFKDSSFDATLAFGILGGASS
jgi:cyclopropane fatty-acyl-phospholipid synthase-like methyltransferase